ncbi:MAG: acyl carrier protein [Crenarchaeota archaeon]|jgi:acyl carrier protein|nr:acyl carrier protein [Thermoproteota archaeon]
MELDLFIKNFAEQFDEADVSVFTAETKFKTLDDWSSMTALTVIAMIDSEYGVQIKGNDIRDSITIKDLFDKIIAQKK